MTRDPLERKLVTAEELRVHLATFLGDGDPAVRRRAVDCLRGYGDDETGRALESAYPSLSAERRRDALEILLSIDSAESLRRFCALFFAEPPGARSVLFPLARRRAFALFPFLVDQLRARAGDVECSRDVLALLSGSGFFDRLALALDHPDERVVLYGLRQAYKYPHGPVARSVRRLLSSGRFAVRHNALLVMTRLETDEARDAVLAALDDPAEKVREAAAAHVAAHFETFSPRLFALFETGDAPRARRALEVLAECATSDALGRLVPFVRDEGPLCAHAARAFERIAKRVADATGGDESQPSAVALSAALVELSLAPLPAEPLHHVRQAVRHVGLPALAMLLTRHEPPPAFEKTPAARLLVGIEPFFTAEAARFAAAAGDRAFEAWVRLSVAGFGPPGVDLALKTLDALPAPLKERLGETLLSLGTDVALVRAAYRELLDAGQPEDREVAYRVLARCGGPEAFAVVRRDLESEDAGVRGVAFGALAAMRGKEAVRLLAEAYARETQEPLKLRALDALAARRDPEIPATLISILRAEAGAMRDAVAERLARHAGEAAHVRAAARAAAGTVEPLAATLRAASPRELVMLSAWLENARRPGDPRLVQHVRAMHDLVPATWSPRMFEAGALLTAAHLLLALDAAFEGGDAESVRSARVLIERADLVPVARLVFPDIFGGGGLVPAAVAAHRRAGSSGLLSALLALASRGDAALRVAALSALRPFRAAASLPVARAALERGGERAEAEAAVELLARLRLPEAYEALAALSAAPGHPLAEYTKRAVEAAREEELL